jgi:crossover junction endodeoxyribonuclease RuvC
MKIISIDPGYERVGIAVVEKASTDSSGHACAGREKLVYSNCFKTDKGLPFLERLELVGKEVERVVKEYKPNAFAIEKLFFNTNQKTATMVSEVRGALIYIALKNKLKVFEYTPLQIKVAVCGDGHGDKKQVIAMIKNLIKIEGEIKYDDEYDAIAVGLTCFASERNL